MNDRIAEPLSRKDIRKYANLIRELAGFEDELYFPIVEFVEWVLPKILPGFVLDICSKEELKNCHGLTYPDRKLMKIREDVYENAVAGIGRDRLTIAHELFHLLQHGNENISFARHGQINDVPPYMSPEWQADAFGGELLIPAHLVKDMTVERISEECAVSFSAATYQKKCL